ncbi:MAG: hypothetical protein AMJ53_06895 [Gammaproteobacteria bacterium SG8_11]|nr:MAG: hypothetical protein AMJ53_06895 [Gammaproteobacteria bacterium SG8_11]
MKRIISIVVLLIVFLFGASFALQNPQKVELSYYFFKFQPELPWIILVSILIGIVLGVIAMLSIVIRLKRDLLKKNKEVKVIEKEVANLRALPLKDKH